MKEVQATVVRALTDGERELLLWLLPEDRPGYREYRSLIERWKVTAQGRRGVGNYILSPPDVFVDLESPLPQVLAYGIVETDKGDISVTIRERLEQQVEFEIASLGKGDAVQSFREIRRWTFSTWSPQHPCPIGGHMAREVSINTTSGRRMVLAVCAEDERIWIYDNGTGINHPIPITNFYNELMLQTRVRDPEIAFDPRRFFAHLDGYSDTDLVKAFTSYNMIRTKIPLEDAIVIPAPPRKPSLISRVISAFRGTGK